MRSCLAWLVGSFILAGMPWQVQMATAQTVLRYSYSTDTVLPAIMDVGPAGNDAMAGPLAAISVDIPTDGVPTGSGNASFDSSDPLAVRANQSGAFTNAVSLLDNDAIEAAGGFTYETWFNWNGGGAVNSIIDYAGTDKLVIDQRAGATTTLAMRMDPNDLPIGDVVAGQWHYVAFTLDTTGNSQVNDTITGSAIAYFDSRDAILLGDATKSAFGDSLVRSIGIGQHPLGFDLDFFDGSVFETRVSLGALSANQLLYTPQGFVEGDVNGDGSADLADFEIIRMNFLNSPAALAEGDLNGSGRVDARDFRIWKNAAFPPPGAGAAVPEPTALGLAALGILLVGRPWRRPRARRT